MGKDQIKCINTKNSCLNDSRGRKFSIQLFKSYRSNLKSKFIASMCAVFTLTPVSLVHAYTSPVHVFSVKDIQGGFDGSTFGTAGSKQDTTIICGINGGAPCPSSISPVVDKQGITLYPVDSEFGFYVIDFLGASAKIRDNDYKEGFVGDIVENGQIIGIKVSNSATDTFKVKPPLGTWCQGLGGNSVKCSTEHYTVMEHILSCHEVIPYLNADPLTGKQKVLSFPGGGDSFDCANAELDDSLKILTGGIPSGDFTAVTQMKANDNTTVLNDIAVSSDYSVTLKDDGKPLYRWGSLIKRPNDLRMYARLALPEQWKAKNAAGTLINDFKVTKARLIVNHLITNNPNDQLRPEDLENEAASGRKPSYRVDGSTWKSTKACYEGDGDLLDSEEGSSESTFIGVGTVLKNTSFAAPSLAGINPPLAFASDLVQGFSNAFYTSLDRDPFEWSYLKANSDPTINEFVGSLVPNDALGSLVSGPRWRLRANKFGQDIPGLEMPLKECSPPPFKNDNIKYVVGEPAITVINLLDWDITKGASPLASSKGWVDVNNNKFVTIAKQINTIPLTTNGLPMTQDFDLGIYIKGDSKSTAVYSAKLEISYEGETLDSIDPKECLLNWAEVNYPSLFSPAAITQSSTLYTYRYYEKTNVYLGISTADNHVYYLGVDRILKDVGDLASWLKTAKCE